MHVIRPEVDVKGFALGCRFADEFQRRIDISGGDLGPFHPRDRTAQQLFSVGHKAHLFFFVVFIQVRNTVQQFGADSLEVGQGLVKSVCGDRRCVALVIGSTHVPLAEMSGCVSCIPQAPGQSGCFWVQPLGHAAFFI